MNEALINYMTGKNINIKVVNHPLPFVYFINFSYY